MKVWVTRAEPGASRTAERLRALGHEPLVAPVLEGRRLPVDIDLTGVGALAFTSGNGVRAFAELHAERGLPAYAVGEATARAAREAGFGVVISANGAVADLARTIRGGLTTDGAVLFAGAAEPAGDLIGELTAQGIPARAVAVYETIPTGARAPEAAEAVLIHSPRAAGLVAAIDGLDLPAFCISRAAAAPLAGWSRVRSATAPNEDDLLALLP